MAQELTGAMNCEQLFHSSCYMQAPFEFYA